MFLNSMLSWISIGSLVSFAIAISKVIRLTYAVPVESSHLIRLHQIINIAAESRIKIGASRQLTAGRFLHPIYTYDPPHALPHNILVHQKLLSKFYGTLSREFPRNLVVGKFKKTSQTSNMKLNSCKSCNEIHFRLAQSIVE